MNKRKVQALEKLVERMNNDKRLKSLKIFESVWDYGRGRVDMSVVIENIKDFKKLNYIQTKYNLQTSDQPTTGQMTFRRVIN